MTCECSSNLIKSPGKQCSINNVKLTSISMKIPQSVSKRLCLKFEMKLNVNKNVYYLVVESWSSLAHRGLFDTNINYCVLSVILI